MSDGRDAHDPALGRTEYDDVHGGDETPDRDDGTASSGQDGDIGGDVLLEVENLRKSFGGITAVDGTTFDIREGTVTGLIGPNGAGKTTTFNLISGFYRPDSGQIRFEGQELTEIMEPSREEDVIWTSAAGLSVGGGAFAAAASAGGVGAAAGAAALGGAALGAGVYYGQGHVRRSVLGHRPTRPFQVARHGLSRTFQITRELQGMTVLDNLLLAPQEQAGERLTNVWLRPGAVERDDRAVRERAEEILGLLELEHLRNEYAGNLSGGQRKLLELGRVLMTDPDLVLLDEPVAGVNPSLTDKLLERIRALRDEGYTFCIVEHDMEVVMKLCDPIIVMHQGKKLTEGSPAEIKRDERVLDAYLGG
jgi:branched-chain amino acid transport system ATP-binding protein